MIPTHEHVVVCTTFATEDEARAFARVLVERRLVACAQLVPIRSVYAWDGSVHDEPEVRVECKTHRDRLDELARVVEAMHPYETPELVALPVVAGSVAYLRFVDDATSAR